MAQQTKPERKWVIGLPDRFGPCEELVMLIPRVFPDDDDHYFVRYKNQVVAASRVFDAPEQAALAAIELNDTKINSLNTENLRLRDWYKSLTQQEVSQ